MKKLYGMVDTKSPSTFKRLKVDATRNFPENCASFICQNHGTRETSLEFPSTTKPVIVETTRNFLENCGPFVRENNGFRKIYLEFPSNTKRVKVDSRRSFPENCGPQKRNGSDTQCSVDADNKGCSKVESAESSNFEATGNTSCRLTNGNQPLKLKEENHQVQISVN
uniref:Uncharacterized protein n=1 Tax=Solanum lycopersicum TaxID=4081 RepID=A0A3Q7FLM9_SOLLC